MYKDLYNKKFEQKDDCNIELTEETNNPNHIERLP